tara:strand:- start:267 stop:734 length:468 start_codon:yes stop_codon:yes gene_type:complete
MSSLDYKVESYMTAISRQSPSRPLRRIIKSSLLKKDMNIIDYGCGKGYDADYLNSIGFDCDSYDPYWKRDVNLTDNYYDVVLCTFVLNVIREHDERALLDNIKRLMKKGGKSYLTVRRDLKKEGETSRGYQRNVRLNLPVLFEYKNSFCTYLMEI